LEISNLSSMTGKIGISMELSNVIIKGTEARDIIAHFMSFFTATTHHHLFCTSNIHTCSFGNYVIIIQHKKVGDKTNAKQLFSPTFTSSYINSGNRCNDNKYNI